MWKYAQLKVAELVGHLLPRRIGYGIARRFADLYWMFDRAGRERVMANLQRIHQHSGVMLSRRALRALARENFLNFAKYLVDFFHFLRLDPRRIQRLVDFANSRDVLDALRGHGKGIIILSAHLGNWELGAAALAMQGYPIHAVALQHSNERVNRMYWDQRKARGLQGIPMGRAARECIAVLRRNEIVALVGDRDFSTACDTVEFFGQPARLPIGPAKLALATGAPILPVYMVRRPDETFTYIIDEPIWADKSLDTIEDVMRQIVRSLECVISRHSEQWFLFHNPWDIETDRALATAAAFGAPVTGPGPRTRAAAAALSREAESRHE